MRTARLVALWLGTSVGAGTAWGAGATDASTRAALAAQVEGEDPAALLSRFAPGQLPDAPAVHNALITLATRGDSADLPLVDRIAQEEHGDVANTARAAAEQLRAGLRQQLRTGFASGLPQVRRPRPSQPGDLGPAESAALAYADRVFADRGIPHPLAFASLPDDGWSALARAREDAGDARGALAIYACAAMQGQDGAIAEIGDFGVDAEQLLLGMAANQPRTGTSLGAAHSIEMLTRTGTEPTATVLLERARGPRADLRAEAIEALGRMLRRGELSNPTAHVVRARLEEARQDPRPDVQEVARDTIVALELAELLRP